MKIVAWTGILLGLSLAACGDAGGSGGAGGNAGGSTASGCEQSPFSCAPGTACGFSDAQGATFACYPSGPGKDGEPCQNLVGSAPCGDQMVCLQTMPPAAGQCSAYCDAAHPCAGSAVCAFVQTVGGKRFQACVPNGGTTSSSSASTTASSTSASTTDASSSAETTGGSSSSGA